MPIEFTIEDAGEHLKVTAKGNDDNAKEAQRYSSAIIEAVLSSKKKRILCDERELVYEISTAETFQMATEAAKHVKTFVKVAIVCNPSFLPDAKFYEVVANNRGLSVSVFTDYDDAVKWLL
ncbi:MAG: hypothetical protein HUU54_10455 [Ignavibacteriaceae bacterium]|nr:hypothetical protein [Ignavibacteriaceae bacterium]